MSRQAGNWLKVYQLYTAESEAPDSFHLWTGLSILASAVRRNVVLNQGIYLLFPNLYVVLVAPAGKIGKSTVIRMGRRILSQIEDIAMGPDSVTREELIRVMAANKDPKQSAVTIHSSEFSSLIEPSGIKMFQFLTDIYDCEYANPGGWRHATKHSGRSTIKNPVLNLLAGTTPSWIAEGFPTSVLSHGFTSRTIFVYEDRKRHLNPFPSEPSKEIVDALTVDLQHISKIEGTFEWGPRAKEKYEELYEEIESTDPDDYRIEGYHHRKRIHVLKVAMLLSLAERDDLIFTAQDLDAAIRLLNIVEANMPKTFSAVGKYDYTAELERILHQIITMGGMKMSEILRRNYAVGGKEVKEIIQNLSSMNLITVERSGTDWICRPLKGAKLRADSDVGGLG